MHSAQSRSDIILRYAQSMTACFGARAGEVAALQRDQAQAIDPQAQRTWAAICVALGQGPMLRVAD
ncbi:hypothetical protein AX777_21430 [Sphingobium yanoikuyae]|uniref:Uncharacterized protein n=2 Tax=Sphingobium TaxID=165695 RepID=A0A0S3F6B7_9SPHN|nr:hypothetical protein ATN00_21355 [Sphingobium baderi]KQO55159.1 hypothetical protein ASF14_19685 [Sphingomonas sp. Leaf257]OAH42045.1 hypothetical protein AX777_21430 [Sphingobium yanoikuyae]